MSETNNVTVTNQVIWQTWSHAKQWSQWLGLHGKILSDVYSRDYHGWYVGSWETAASFPMKIQLISYFITYSNTIPL